MDTTAMANFVGCGQHYISIFLDHDESIRAVDWDDVAEFPVAELPPVISPVKHVVIDDDAPGEVEDAPIPLQVVHDEDGVRTRSRSNLSSNNYAIEEEDDDLYAENVDGDEDKVKRMKGKTPKIEGDGDSEDDDIWAPKSDEGCHELRFKTFRPEDLTAPVFRVGLKFEDVALLRRAIKEYACQNRRDINIPINDLKRLKAVCKGSKSCPWVVQKDWNMTPAIAAVEVEDTDNWTWFLQTFKVDLGIDNTHPWTNMSNKQKGLINAVRQEFPESEHRFCVRHLWQNFNQLFRGDALKNQLWIIARSSIVVKYEKNMQHMKLLNPDAYECLDALDPNTWVRAFQSDLPKCDILLNNNCEVFNK
ncbi:hypothetical protein ACQ4PT_016609 [Festuca glaucescens]